MAKENNKVEIWIIEDDPMLRDSYQSLINESSGFFISKTFRTGEEAIRTLKTVPPPRIVLMDIELPGRSGVDCTAIIKEQFPEVLVVMVTVYEDSELVFNSLK